MQTYPRGMDTGEFDIKVLSMKDRIFRLAKSILCDYAEAEDATQDILEKLWLRRDSLAVYENLSAFIYVSAKNHCLDRLRSRKIQDGRMTSSDRENLYAQESDIDARDMKQVVEKLIAELPEKQQLVIHLRDIEGMEFEEIAAITGTDTTTARVTLSRARKTVREKLIKLMNYGT